MEKRQPLLVLWPIGLYQIMDIFRQSLDILSGLFKIFLSCVNDKGQLFFFRFSGQPRNRAESLFFIHIWIISCPLILLI